MKLNQWVIRMCFFLFSRERRKLKRKTWNLMQLQFKNVMWFDDWQRNKRQSILTTTYFREMFCQFVVLPDLSREWRKFGTFTPIEQFHIHSYWHLFIECVYKKYTWLLNAMIFFAPFGFHESSSRRSTMKSNSNQKNTFVWISHIIF